MDTKAEKFYVVEYKSAPGGFTRVIEFEDEGLATEFLNESNSDWIERAFYYTKEETVKQFGKHAFANRMTIEEYNDAWINNQHRP